MVGPFHFFSSRMGTYTICIWTSVFLATTDIMSVKYFVFLVLCKFIENDFPRLRIGLVSNTTFFYLNNGSIVFFS